MQYAQNGHPSSHDDENSNDWAEWIEELSIPGWVQITGKYVLEFIDNHLLPVLTILQTSPMEQERPICQILSHVVKRTVLEKFIKTGRINEHSEAEYTSKLYRDMREHSCKIGNDELANDLVEVN